MSIDATVSAVIRTRDGKAHLILVPRQSGEKPGQRILVVDLWTPELAKLLHQDIWGNASKIMIGDTQLGERIGYTGLKITHPDYLPTAKAAALAAGEKLRRALADQPPVPEGPETTGHLEKLLYHMLDNQRVIMQALLELHMGQGG